MSARTALVLAATAAVLADVASKVAAVAWLDDGPVRMGPVLTLRLVHNAGVAFGVGSGAPDAIVLGGTATMAVGIVVLAWRGSLGAAVPAGLVVGGALANVADRATGGTVVDFLDVGRWPTFNLADVLLIMGVALLVLRPQRDPPVAAPIAEAACRR